MADASASVTILIPTYNRADYLRTTILSVLGQTVPGVQVLVLDDCSTDATPEVVASFAGESRVRGIRHANNLGMAGNWKAGIAAVETDFFCLLNDDDLLQPTFVEKLLRPLLADSDLILAFCDHDVIDENGELLAGATQKHSARHGRKRLTGGKLADFGAAVALHRSLHISCTLFRSAMVPADFVDEKAGGFACGWLFYESYRTGHGAFYVDERLASYRIHPGNMLQNDRWENYLARGQIFWLHRMLEDDLPEPLRQPMRGEAAEIFSSYASSWLSAGNRTEAGALFAESYALRRKVKSFMGLVLCRMGPPGTAVMPFLRRFKPQRAR